MSSMDLSMSFSGSDVVALLRGVVTAFFGQQVPTELRVDQKGRKIGASWIDEWAGRAEVNLEARFGDDEISCSRVSMEPGKIVKVDKLGAERRVEPIVEALAALPFELAVAARVHRAWRDTYQMGDGTTFADGHHMHGLLCAFKGVGHDRLVSRRWLEFGPWKLHRAANDTSVVQFHDLAADPETALEQARPGHQRMGISDVGGFVQRGFVFEHGLDGDYDPEQERLLIDAPSDGSSAAHMLEACALRGASPGRPVQRVGFRFHALDVARAHLHELWLRGLECWHEGSRLDDAYDAKPSAPGWAL